MHTVSFVCIDDFKYGPEVNIEVADLNRDNLLIAVKNIGDEISKAYYFNQLVKTRSEELFNDIVDSLLEHGHYVLNQFDKYYVVAFALDYKRFNVYSRGYDKELIKWSKGCIGDIDRENSVFKHQF